MVTKSKVAVFEFAGVAVCLVGLLFGESAWSAYSAFIGFISTEFTSLFQDPETQLTVFLCLTVYFTVFLFFRFKMGTVQRSIWPSETNFPASKIRDGNPHLQEVTAPAVWLVGGISISLIAYAFNFPPSTQALTLLAGAVLGQGMAVMAIRARRRLGFKSKNETVEVIITILVIFLGFASMWKLDEAKIFDFRDHARWSGPWDNPNIYGVLMGTGAALAIGCAIPHLEFKISNWKTDRWRRLKMVFLLVVSGLIACGLLKSYSRGAWLATVLGTGYLVWSIRLRRSCYGGREVHPLSPQLPPSSRTVDFDGAGRRTRSPSALARVATVGDRSKVGAESDFLCGSRISRLKFSLLPIIVILISAVVLSFWQFRQTGWRPAHRVFSAINTADFSWRNRVAAWEGALQITGEHPWFGVGWSQPELLYNNYCLAPKLTESKAIEMNDYLMLAATLGIPASFCFGMYFWLSLTTGAGRGAWGARSQNKEEGGSQNEESEAAELEWLKSTCRAGAIVLLVGFWFDGGLFKLATASTFWILLELGSVANGGVRERLQPVN
jgi:O-antigen ligase